MKRLPPRSTLFPYTPLSRSLSAPRGVPRALLRARPASGRGFRTPPARASAHTRPAAPSARCRRRRLAVQPPAPSAQNDRNAPTLKLVLLFELPLCASAFTSVTSASSVRFLVSES